jgi:hypothetical protein
VAKGQHVAAGVVTQVRPDEVAVQPATGQMLKFRVDDGTKVQVDGRTSSADRITEGQQARVAYEPSGNGPRAVSIRVGSADATRGVGNGSTSNTGTGSSSVPSEPMPDQSQNTAPPNSSPAPSDQNQAPAAGTPVSQ